MALGRAERHHRAMNFGVRVRCEFFHDGIVDGVGGACRKYRCVRQQIVACFFRIVERSLARCEHGGLKACHRSQPHAGTNDKETAVPEVFLAVDILTRNFERGFFDKSIQRKGARIEGAGAANAKIAITGGRFDGYDAEGDDGVARRPAV